MYFISNEKWTYSLFFADRVHNLVDFFTIFIPVKFCIDTCIVDDSVSFSTRYIYVITEWDWAWNAGSGSTDDDLAVVTAVTIKLTELLCNFNLAQVVPTDYH